MPQHVIDRVHQLADKEGAQNLDNNGCPVFEWEIGAPVNDDHEPIIANIVPISDDGVENSDSKDREDEDEDTDNNNDNASTEFESDHPPSSNDDDSRSDDDNSYDDDDDDDE